MQQLHALAKLSDISTAATNASSTGMTVHSYSLPVESRQQLNDVGGDIMWTADISSR